jgi:hypothetical protein
MRKKTRIHPLPGAFLFRKMYAIMLTCTDTDHKIITFICGFVKTQILPSNPTVEPINTFRLYILYPEQ